MDVSGAAAQSRRALLIALRDRVAGQIDKPDLHPRDLSSLSKQLLTISDELETFSDDEGLALTTVIEDQAW